MVEPIKMVENLYRAFESRKQAFKKIEDYSDGINTWRLS